MNWIRRLERRLTLPKGSYIPDKGRSRRMWFSESTGHISIAVSAGGHIMLSGKRRRLILCGRKIQDMESATNRKWTAKDGVERSGYSVSWKVHLPVSTSLKLLLKPSVGITCQTCRDLLEHIDGRLPA